MNLTNEIKAKTGEKYPMTGEFGCNSKGIIYLAKCSNCQNQYVGQTGRRFHDRIMEHLRYIKNGTQALGIHFKDTTCESKDLLVQVIEKVVPNTDPMRLQREKFWIKKLDTKVNGLNRTV